MRDFDYHDIDEMGLAQNYMDGIARPRFRSEQMMVESTNPQLLANFMKVAKWIEDNCPNLNGEFSCRHNPFYKIDLIIENGKAYLCYGSHSVGYALYLSSTETAVYSQGSCQGAPYAFKGIFFYRNDMLEEFLSQWQTIKARIILANEVQRRVFDENFQA
jgi:hypothetical protein